MWAVVLCCVCRCYCDISMIRSLCVTGSLLHRSGLSRCPVSADVTTQEHYCRGGGKVMIVLFHYHVGSTFCQLCPVFHHRVGSTFLWLCPVFHHHTGSSLFLLHPMFLHHVVFLLVFLCPSPFWFCCSCLFVWCRTSGACLNIMGHMYEPQISPLIVLVFYPLLKLKKLLCIKCI